jgi:membrane protein DedA with SNARE-associated domain
MHRFTLDPDFHDRRAKKIFARSVGYPQLVAELVLGLDAVAAPLATASRSSRLHFLVFNAASAGLQACVYGGLGYLFWIAWPLSPFADR